MSESINGQREVYFTVSEDEEREVEWK